MTKLPIIPPLTVAVLIPSIGLCAPAAYAQEHHDEAEEGDEDIVVQATRSGRRVQDEAIRVEVIGREGIEEKMLMTPGNVSMLVAETPGVRVQVTSPALGSSNKLFEHGLIDAVRSTSTRLNAFGIGGPWAVFVTLLGIKDYRLVLGDHRFADPA